MALLPAGKAMLPFLQHCPARDIIKLKEMRSMSTELRIIPVSGIGEVPPGADLGHIIYEALQRQHLRVEHGDVFIVTQKIVSKAEGRVVNLDEIEASEFAQAFALEYEKDPQHVEVV